jgi:hypothetical protein
MVELLNGAPAVDVSEWEIVTVGQHGYIGRVVLSKPDEGEVILSPCYAYSFGMGRGPQGMEIQRNILPCDMMCSNVPYRIRWSTRRRLEDYNAQDRKMLVGLIAEAHEMQTKKLPAARAGIELAPSGIS